MAVSGFSILGSNFINGPAAFSGDLPNLLWATSNQTPVLNSFEQTSNMFGQAPPMGSEMRPFPAGAFPDASAGGTLQGFPGIMPQLNQDTFSPVGVGGIGNTGVPVMNMPDVPVASAMPTDFQPPMMGCSGSFDTMG